MNDEERILEKVRRLFALATSPNQFEAEAAAAKAQELLHKYNLERSQIEVIEAPYIRELVQLKTGERSRKQLLNVLGKANGCFVVQLSSEGPRAMAVIGQRHNIEVTLYSYQQMDMRIKWLADVAWDIYMGTEHESVYRENFSLGLVNSLSKKLTKQVEEQRAESSTSTAMVVKADAALNTAVTNYYPRLGKARSASISGDGYWDGQKAGRHLNVHPGVTAGATGTRQLQ